MTYIVGLYAYELHLGDEKVFNNFMMNARILHFTYDSGCYSKAYLYTHVNDYIGM